jgi:hypothetical protein
MEQGMSVIHRVMKLGVLAVLAATVTGCIVLPYGARGHHGGHHVAPAERPPVMHGAPQPRHDHRR